MNVRLMYSEMLLTAHGKIKMNVRYAGKIELNKTRQNVSRSLNKSDNMMRKRERS